MLTLLEAFGQVPDPRGSRAQRHLLAISLRLIL